MESRLFKLKNKVMKEEKFVYLDLLVRCGEYEFNCKSVHLVPEGISSEEHVEKYASSFYDSEVEKDDRWYCFNGGEIAVRVYEYRDVSQSESVTLIKYL